MNDTEKEDRRIKKTKKALEEALIDLMLEKELRNITIRELTDRADVHRATFYSHYQDIYDLYEQIEDSAITDLNKIIISQSSHVYDSLYPKLITYIYNNARLYRMLFNKKSNGEFLERISNLLEDKYLEIWKYETGQDTVTNEWWYYVRYHMQGCLSIIRLWINSDFNLPKENISAIFYKIDENFDNLV